MAAAATPPLPPDIQAQASPEQAQSVFQQQGVGPDQPQPGMQVVQQLAQQMQKLDQWLGETLPLVKQVDPNLLTFLGPIANAGKDFMAALAQKAKKSGMAQGSPVVSPQTAMNPAAPPPNPNAT